MATSSPIDTGAQPDGLRSSVRPLRICVLSALAVDMFQAAADLPEPESMTVFGILDGDAHDYVSVQFGPAEPSERAIAQWAQRFGGTITSHPMAGDTGRELWVKTEFPFGTMQVRAFAHIPLPDDGEVIFHTGQLHRPGTRQACDACMAECYCGTVGALCVSCIGYPPF